MNDPSSPEQDSPLAAMATVIADGYLPTDLERKAMELALIDKAIGDEANPASWGVIGRVLGMTGPEAKRHARKLREEVRRASLLAAEEEGLGPFLVAHDPSQMEARGARFRRAAQRP